MHTNGNRQTYNEAKSHFLYVNGLQKMHFYFQEDINFFCAQIDFLVQDT